VKIKTSNFSNNYFPLHEILSFFRKEKFKWNLRPLPNLSQGSLPIIEQADPIQSQDEEMFVQVPLKNTYYHREQSKIHHYSQRSLQKHQPPISDSLHEPIPIQELQTEEHHLSSLSKPPRFR
jgi:hypothetical protein